MKARILVAALLAVTACFAPSRGRQDLPIHSAIVLDDFDGPISWKALPADGVDLAIGSDPHGAGQAMRLDIRFQGGGYAVARREVSLDLPENYVFTFRVRGDIPPNHLEFKLIDSTGANVWWHVKRDFVFRSLQVKLPPSAEDRGTSSRSRDANGADWRRVSIKKRHVQFAWGPRGGGEIDHVAAIELAVTAGSGGAGTVWIDDLTLQPLPPPGAIAGAPAIRASSAVAGHEPALALDGRAETAWEPSGSGDPEWIQLDFGSPREFGGVALDWADARAPADCSIELSDDAVSWRVGDGVEATGPLTGASSEALAGCTRLVETRRGRWRFPMPESEARFLRVAIPGSCSSSEGEPPTLAPRLREIHVMPLEWAATPNAFAESIAREGTRGDYPRGIAGEHTEWTVIGVPGDDEEALFDTDGRLEVGRQRFSLEPFLYAGGRLLTWADVVSEPSLEEPGFPNPAVTWRAGDLTLRIFAFAFGDPVASSVIATYEIEASTPHPEPITLFLAARPFQVNPPVQFLNLHGGIAPTREMSRADLEGPGFVADRRLVRCLTPPSGMGFLHPREGDLVRDFLREQKLPPHEDPVRDAGGWVSGALAYSVAPIPGTPTRVHLAFSLHDTWQQMPLFVNDDAAADWVSSQRASARDLWLERQSRASIELPPVADRYVETLHAQLSYILINATSTGIQPGTRAYARSWIRDGSLTSSALLRLGHAEPVRRFIEWFAPHQFETGKIPCVVDWRGADPVPEHDSSGEFIYLVAEYYRYTRDTAFAGSLWPRVARAVAYLDSLRHERLTPEYDAAELAHFRGLLPPSISHEGYSAEPMHSYWDDFFARKGFHDAVYLAEELGLAADAARISAIRDAFDRDLAASVQAALRVHAIDYVPGCADLGDFDATSTTIALSPTDAVELLPDAAVRATFAKYDTFFTERAAGAPWDAFTPYEIRNVGAFVRLGHRERAHELAAFFFDHQTPPAWRQWPEVVWHDRTAPRFVGDLPHTWVGSDYVRSFLDMLVYDTDEGLVIGAGILPSWLEGPGVEVRDLRTRWGKIRMTVKRAGDAVLFELDGEPALVGATLDLRLPGAGDSTLAEFGEEPRPGRATPFRIEKLPVRLRTRN